MLVQVILTSMVCIWFWSSASPLALADLESNSGELRMQAESYYGTDALSAKTKQIAVGVLVVLVTGIVGIGLWSSTSSRKAANLMGLRQGLSAQNLFLGITYAEADQSESMGYFRSLDMKEATFVSNRYYSRGEDLQFKLMTLPGFPLGDARVQGQVVNCRSIGGSPESYLVAVKFHDVSEQTKSSLGKYIRELTKRSTAYSRA